MIDYILKLDFALSYWFSKTNNKVIPGTSFLFLNKLGFITTSLFVAMSKLSILNLQVELFVGLIVGVAAIIMFVFQKPLERIINERQYTKEHQNLKKIEILKRRIIGIIVFAFFFMLMFLPVFFW